MIGGYFARVITEDDEKRMNRSRSRSRSRRHRRRSRSRSSRRRRGDSRHRRRSRSRSHRRRSRSRDKYRRRSRSHEKSSRDKRRSRSKESRSENHRNQSEKVTEHVPLPNRVGNEQENIIDSTIDVTENVGYHQKSEPRSRRSSSPSPVKKERMKERSLSPGTKEIRAYWAEQEEKKKKKKAKKSKDKERDEDVDMFAEVETEKKRHASGSSIDSIEKLRLQALETLKSPKIDFT